MWKRLFVLMALGLGFLTVEHVEGQLNPNFYRSSCPNLESIVKGAVQNKLSQTVATIPATLRLFFHDCLIEGCDASIMIALRGGEAEKEAPENLSLAGDGFDTVIKAKQAVEAQCPGVVSCADILAIAARDVVVLGCDASIMIALRGGEAEKEAPENLSLAGDGFDTVIKAKQAVEAQCPGVVSCADILAIAARDVVVLAGGPAFAVELGRRDGLISQAGRAAGRIPSPDSNLDQLIARFRQMSLSMEDMIALSGAHTVGLSHCKPFQHRLYGFNSSTGVDPSMNPMLAAGLKKVCPQGVDPNIATTMDFQTPLTFDNAYYRILIQRAGLFTSDQVLYDDRRSQRVVRRFADDQAKFFEAFTEAMVKLGRVEVKTGKQGEIRRNCATFN